MKWAENAWKGGMGGVVLWHQPRPLARHSRMCPRSCTRACVCGTSSWPCVHGTAGPHTTVRVRRGRTRPSREGVCVCVCVCVLDGGGAHLWRCMRPSVILRIILLAS